MNLNQTPIPAGLDDDIETKEYALPLCLEDADEIARQYLIDIDSFDMFEDAEETPDAFSYWLDSGATLVVKKADGSLSHLLPA